MIKILFLAANPKDTDPRRLDEEVRTIKEKLRLADLRDQFVVEQEWAVRVTDLEGHLLHHRPQIVHFCGHGSPAGEIILEDVNGVSKPVSPKSIGRLFKTLKDNILCVILDVCYGQLQAEGIAESIDCVVGMTRAIPDESAIAFAASIYQAIGYGRSIQTAFDLGCEEIGLEGLDDADVPKLLTGHGIIAKNYFISKDTFPKSIVRPLDDRSHLDLRDHDFTHLQKVIQKKYTLIRILGKGHASLVTLAFDKQLQRHLTIKSLTDPQAAPIFDNAVRRAANISRHPNIMSIYGAWLNKEPHHYMREYVDGHSLRIELERQGQSPLPIDFIQQVFAAVGDAMIFAQELGVTDIDIKPENIIIQRMQVKLNLGLSSNYRIMLSPEIGDKEMLGKREYLKFLMSNIVYFPPELFNASNVYSNSTDPEKVNQYRLGMLGYEMLSASEQFKREAETRSKTLAGSTLPAGSVMFTAWPPVETMRREGCPKFISLAIDRMIAPDPKDRFQTLSEAVNAVAYRNLSVEVARESYRRILNDYKKETEFFRTFYNRFLDYCPPAAKHFEDSGFPSRTALDELDTRNPSGRWPEQFTLLKEAIVLLFAFNILNESQEPTILDRIARKHIYYPSFFYDSFVNALVETVLEFDKNNYGNELKRAWENALRPGIDYMKNFQGSQLKKVAFAN
jgi:serine/threonine protein kinase